MAQRLEVRKVMEIDEVGLDRTAGADQAVLAFARYAEARIAKWIQFPRGVLLFLTVPGDLESGWFYLLDRKRGTFYSLDVNHEGRWGGYREDEFDGLVEAFGLKRFAERPRELASLAAKRF